MTGSAFAEDIVLRSRVEAFMADYAHAIDADPA